VKLTSWLRAIGVNHNTEVVVKFLYERGYLKQRFTVGRNKQGLPSLESYEPRPDWKMPRNAAYRVIARLARLGAVRLVDRYYVPQLARWVGVYEVNPWFLCFLAHFLVMCQSYEKSVQEAKKNV
jgi:hypothetical protein